MKKITVTKEYDVSGDSTYCLEGSKGGGYELCVHYKHRKKKGGVKNHARIHFCTLFECELEAIDVRVPPIKCQKCLEASR